MRLVYRPCDWPDSVSTTPLALETANRSLIATNLLADAWIYESGNADQRTAAYQYRDVESGRHGEHRPVEWHSTGSSHCDWQAGEHGTIEVVTKHATNGWWSLLLIQPERTFSSASQDKWDSQRQRTRSVIFVSEPVVSGGVDADAITASCSATNGASGASGEQRNAYGILTGVCGRIGFHDWQRHECAIKLKGVFEDLETFTIHSTTNEIVENYILTRPPFGSQTVTWLKAGFRWWLESQTESATMNDQSVNRNDASQGGNAQTAVGDKMD